MNDQFIDYAADRNWEYCLIDAFRDTQAGYEKMEELAGYLWVAVKCRTLLTARRPDLRFPDASILIFYIFFWEITEFILSWSHKQVKKYCFTESSSFYTESSTSPFLNLSYI